MWPPSGREGIIAVSPGKELNIAQHARRQAAVRRLGSALFLLSKVTAANAATKGEGLHADD
jgi:hypothetical protein